MKNILCIILLTVGSLRASAQNESTVWVFGSNALNGDFNSDFQSGQMQIDSVSRNMNLYMTNSSMCDENGRILFYTNGIYIANALNDTIQNGAGINPGSFSNGWGNRGLPLPQAVVTINDPGNPNNYYLFHLVVDSNTNTSAKKLRFSKVDMTLASGLGAVTVKNQIVFYDSLIPANLVAVKHANGRDWWIVSHQNHSNLFHTILVSPLGIQGPFDQRIGKIMNWWGTAKFSPDGTKYASYDNTNGLQLIEFDRCSGSFYSDRYYAFQNDTFAATGVSFSPDSKLLYVSRNPVLVQVNTDSISLEDGMDTVAVWDGFFSNQIRTGFGCSELGINNKIYITPLGGTSVFHVVEMPDIPGSGCTVTQHAILTPGAVYTPPSFPNFSLGSIVGSVCDSIINSVVEIDQHLFVLYPNPTSGKLVAHLTAAFFQDATINIFNSVGQLICSDLIHIGMSEFIIDMERYDNGIYSIQLIVDDHVGSLRVIKL